MASYRVICGIQNKYFDEDSYFDLMDYITGTSKAVYIGGTGNPAPVIAAAEMETIANRFGKNSGKRLRHSILSFMPNENVSLALANEYAQKLIQFYAPEYQIYYAVHGNTDHVHIHMIMNQISHVDGHRYRGQKKDYYNFINFMGAVTHLPIIPVHDRYAEE